jgi:RNA polymerase sigma-70 factor (ECF subfamily)
LEETILIQRATNGEAAAWEPLMLAHQEPVFRLAYLFLGDADDAEDITQETFLRAYHNLKRFDPTRPLRPWLLSIAANLARNRFRSTTRYLAALTRSFRADTKPALDVERRAALNQDADQLWKAVRQLNADDQQVIYLRFFLDLSTAEAAQALDVEGNAVQDLDADHLWKAVRQLNADDQQIIYLRFFLDLSTAETSQALDVAEGTVKSRLNRAVGRLRVIIKNDFPTLSEGYEI